MWLVPILEEFYFEEGHSVAVAEDFSVNVGQVQHDLELQEKLVDVVCAVVLALDVCQSVLIFLH